MPLTQVALFMHDATKQCPNLASRGACPRFKFLYKLPYMHTPLFLLATKHICRKFVSVAPRAGCIW